MQLFIDGSNPGEIRQACEWGLVDGVTTNPIWKSVFGETVWPGGDR